MHPPSHTQILSKTYSKPKNKIKRKRRRKQSDRPSIAPAQNVIPPPPHHNESIFNSDHSLRDDYWMDEFDLLAQGRTPLRKGNVIRKNVRADYNRDSSIEGSPMPLSPLLLSRLINSPPFPDSPFKVPARPSGKFSRRLISTESPRSSSDQFSILAKQALLESHTSGNRSIIQSIPSSLNASVDEINDENISTYLNNTIEDFRGSSYEKKKKTPKKTSGSFEDNVIKPIFFKRNAAGSSGSVDSSAEEFVISSNESDVSFDADKDPPYPLNKLLREGESLPSPSTADNNRLQNQETVMSEGNINLPTGLLESFNESIFDFDQVSDKDTNSQSSANLAPEPSLPQNEGKDNIDERINSEQHEVEEAFVQQSDRHDTGVHCMPSVSNSASPVIEVRHPNNYTIEQNVGSEEPASMTRLSKANNKKIIELVENREKSKTNEFNETENKKKDTVPARRNRGRPPKRKVLNATLDESPPLRHTFPAVKESLQIDVIASKVKKGAPIKNAERSNRAVEKKSSRKEQNSKKHEGIHSKNIASKSSSETVSKNISKKDYLLTNEESKRENQKPQHPEKIKATKKQMEKGREGVDIEQSDETHQYNTRSNANPNKYFLRSRPNSQNKSVVKKPNSKLTTNRRRGRPPLQPIIENENPEPEIEGLVEKSNNTAEQNATNERLMPSPSMQNPPESVDVPENSTASPLQQNKRKTPKQCLIIMKKLTSSLPSTPVWKNLRRVKVKLKRIHMSMKKRKLTFPPRESNDKNATKRQIHISESQQDEMQHSCQDDVILPASQDPEFTKDNAEISQINNKSKEVPQSDKTVARLSRSENEEDSDSDSSIDSLLDFNTYSILVNASRLEKSPGQNETSRESQANLTPLQSVSTNLNNDQLQVEDVIRKRKSRLPVSKTDEETMNKAQKLQNSGKNLELKNFRIKLKRVKVLSRRDKSRKTKETLKVKNLRIKLKKIKTPSSQNKPRQTIESLELASKDTTSRETLNPTSITETTADPVDSVSTTLDTTKRANNTSSKSVRINLERTTISSPNCIQDSSKSNLPTPNQTHVTTLQRSLDDSIDRDDFITAITRNATQFMNKSSVRLMSISENLPGSLQNESPISSPRYVVPVARRSSILGGSAVPSLIATLCEIAENQIDGDDSVLTESSFILPSGKWRKALNQWKKTNSMIADKTFGTLSANNSINITNNQSSTSISRRGQQLKNYQNSPTTNTSYMLLSSRRGSSVVRKDNVHVSNVESENLKGRSLRHSNVKTKRSAFVLTRPEPILEHHSPSEINRSKPTSHNDNVNVLLLEPTDDEAPNLPSISLLESAVEQNLHITSRSLQKDVESARTKAAATTESTTVADIIDQQQQQKSYPRRLFNETDSNEYHRQIYQHQLSVPVYRQPSIPRRRRTSVVERSDDHSIIPIPTSGGRQRHLNGAGDGSDDNLHYTDYRHIPYERGILSTSLSPRDRVLRRCNQFEPLDFSIVYSENVLRHCRKIGEGVYGEVFMNKTVRGDAVVLKIIPIEGSIEVNGEPQKTFEQILSEIIIAMELSRLRDDEQFMTSGFVDVKKVCCVQGRYPDHLIDLWELYRDNCGTENDHPEIFPEDQIYIVLELANGGQDLEAFTFQNALQSYSAFAQTALTLAVAEQKFQFEHRDLHWGNILLAPTDEPTIVFRLNGEEIKVPSHGVKATIIDYTLSRMVYNGCCLYNDLSNDSELFLAGGDYQFDIYRFMKQHLKNQWTAFEPYTNILWLHYTIDKMISGARYRCSKSKKHRSAIQDMMRLRDELLDFKSASDYVECLK